MLLVQTTLQITYSHQMSRPSIFDMWIPIPGKTVFILRRVFGDIFGMLSTQYGDDTKSFN